MKKTRKKTDQAKRRNPRALTEHELGAASGAAQTYLSIDGIKGESQESNHKDWIEVLSFSHATK